MYWLLFFFKAFLSFRFRYRSPIYAAVNTALHTARTINATVISVLMCLSSFMVLRLFKRFTPCNALNHFCAVGFSLKIWAMVKSAFVIGINRIANTRLAVHILIEKFNLLIKKLTWHFCTYPNDVPTVLIHYFPNSFSVVCVQMLVLLFSSIFRLSSLIN